jgi:hypothetical protein
MLTMWPGCFIPSIPVSTLNILKIFRRNKLHKEMINRLSRKEKDS